MDEVITLAQLDFDLACLSECLDNLKALANGRTLPMRAQLFVDEAVLMASRGRRELEDAIGRAAAPEPPTTKEGE